MQRNARRTADRKYMETLKKSGVDYDRLRQSSREGSKRATSVADNGSDYTHDEAQSRSADTSLERSSRGERSPDRESIEDESVSHRSRPAASQSPSAPDYTQEYDDDDDDGDSMIQEQDTDRAWCDELNHQSRAVQSVSQGLM